MLGTMLLFLSVVLASSSDRCSIALQVNMTIEECHNLGFVVQYPPKGHGTCSREFINRTLALISSMNSTLDFLTKYVNAATVEVPETDKRIELLSTIKNETVDPVLESDASAFQPSARPITRAAAIWKIAEALERKTQSLEEETESLSTPQPQSNQTEEKPDDDLSSLQSLHLTNASEFLAQATSKWERMTDIVDHITDFSNTFERNVNQMDHANTCQRTLQRVSKSVMLDFEDDDAGIKYVEAGAINSTCLRLLSDEHGNKLDSVSSNSDRCKEYDRQLRAQSHRRLLGLTSLESGEATARQLEVQTCLNDLKFFTLVPSCCDSLESCAKALHATGGERHIKPPLKKLCEEVEKLFQLPQAQDTEPISASQPLALAESKLLMDQSKLLRKSEMQCVDELFAIFDAYKANVEMKGKVKSCAAVVNLELQNRVDDCKSALKLVLEWEAYPIRNLYYLLQVPRRCSFLNRKRIIYIYVSSTAVVFASAVLLGCLGSCLQCCVLLFQCCRRCCKRSRNEKGRSFSSSSSEV